MSSVKNKLQEHFQKRGLELPKYQTECVSHNGTHKPMFISTVHLSFPKRSITGDERPNKKAAELSAAEKALTISEDFIKKAIEVLEESISTQHFEKVDHFSLITINKNKVRIIDMDNRANDIFITAPNTQNIGIGMGNVIECFVNKNKEKIPEGSSICIVSASGKHDLVDLHISLLAYKLAKKDIEITLVSNDHFIHTLSDVLNKDKTLSNNLIVCE